MARAHKPHPNPAPPLPPDGFALRRVPEEVTDEEMTAFWGPDWKQMIAKTSRSAAENPHPRYLTADAFLAELRTMSDGDTQPLEPVDCADV